MELTVGEAAKQTGWTPRMLRYLEDAELVVPARRQNGYRVYGLRELNRLRSLRGLRSCFRGGLSDLAFAGRMRREPGLRDSVHTWLAGGESALEWEQRKHERLLVA